MMTKFKTTALSSDAASLAASKSRINTGDPCEAARADLDWLRFGMPLFLVTDNGCAFSNERLMVIDPVTASWSEMTRTPQTRRSK